MKPSTGRWLRDHGPSPWSAEVLGNRSQTFDSWSVEGQDKSIWSYTFSPLRARSINRFNPVGFYEILVLEYKAGSISFRDVDEYIGIPHEHPESYHTFMYKYFFSHVNVHPRNIHILNGSVTDLEAECVPTGPKVPKMAPTVGVQIVLEVRKAGAQKLFALQNYIEGGGNHMQTLSSL
ncbi:hypothetical protein JHW43_002842 [Diplocarpon mali]|nr:hypothetical protein JHW43_002842 [Diplocarpon mali]